MLFFSLALAVLRVTKFVRNGKLQFLFRKVYPRAFLTVRIGNTYKW